MGWYIRKSIKVGPVRFNLSKSGMGASVGVKGFRIGVRPNGSSYLHAGGYGLYYREELGGKCYNYSQPNQQYTNYSIPSDVKFYNNVGSRDLDTSYRKELVDEMTKSYRGFRFDYLSGILFVLMVVYLLFQKHELIYYYWGETKYNSILALLIAIGVILTFLVAKWETNRRRIDLIYSFDDDNYDYYKRIISAFNEIASCKEILGVVSSQYLSNSYQSKINAGANNLQDNLPASAGKGKMPWINANIDIPSIKVCGRCFYFMPDGLYVYDSHGIACVKYQDIEISSYTSRYISDYAPSDAFIIDYTWQYVNKNGSPDMRFKDNTKMPVCLYGVLDLKVDNKELLHIMTSKPEAPADFENSMNQFSKYIKKVGFRVKKNAANQRKK